MPEIGLKRNAVEISSRICEAIARSKENYL